VSASEIRNATIKSTMLGIEDHGIMTFYVHLDYGGVQQGFGGWALDDKPAGRSNKRPGTAFGMECLIRILRVLRADTWESLRGKPCRARIEGGLVKSIGHCLNDEWWELPEVQP